jgi:drug/metabolite transporter (DMT)-like permease
LIHVNAEDMCDIEIAVELPDIHIDEDQSFLKMCTSRLMSGMNGHKGIRDALAAAVLFGLSAPLAKVLVRDLSPQLLAGLLYIGSGLGLTIVAVVRSRNPRSNPGLHPADIPFLAGAIAVGGIAAPVLLMFGLQRTPASSASLLLNLEAVFTAAIAWAIFRENISSRIAAGLLAILAGGVVLSWNGSLQLTGYSGPLAIAAACLCWGADNNLTQRISAADPVRIGGLKGIAAGTVNTLLAVSMGQWHYTPRIWSALSLGFVSYGLSLVVYIRGLRELGTARAGNYFSVAPFVGAVVGVIVLREPVTFGLSAAGCLMGLGIWLHFTEKHEHFHVHEPMTHEHQHTHDMHHQHEHSPDDPPGEPHTHPHRHEHLEHAHRHYPDIHHRHPH